MGVGVVVWLDGHCPGLVATGLIAQPSTEEPEEEEEEAGDSRSAKISSNLVVSAW